MIFKNSRSASWLVRELTSLWLDWPRVEFVGELSRYSLQYGESDSRLILSQMAYHKKKEIWDFSVAIHH